MGARSAAQFSFVEGAGIGVCGKYHVAGPEGGAIIQIGSNIFLELVSSIHCVGCCSCLLRADGAEGDKNLVVDCSGII